jgi:hypothetical protein
MLFLVE